MSEIEIWGYKISRNSLSNIELEYLMGLPKLLPSVEWVWDEMNRIWFLQNLDNNQDINIKLIDDYYAHPVWLMNGIFTAVDPVSTSHRVAIAKYLKLTRSKSIADYGGGFGELALAITKAIPNSSVSIVEPYPSRVGLERLNNVSEIKFVSKLEVQYDAAIAQDVLEHVENPIQLAFQMANSVRVGGILIFANCFYPVIQCHLPATFHLRYTFPWIMKTLGLSYIGTIDGAAHAQIYEKTNNLSLNNALKAETLSRLIHPIISLTRKIKRYTKLKISQL